MSVLGGWGWRQRLGGVPVALLLLGASAARAGEQLTVAELLARSGAVAQVTVRFERGRRLHVSVSRWLWRASAAEPFFDPAGSTCLPTRSLLQHWRLAHRNLPRRTRTLWARLARAEGYRAVVFLRQQGARLLPYCELEALQLQHVAAHPAHQAWRKALHLAIDAAAVGSRGAPSKGAGHPR
ncbi:MAG: hypothetical protein IPL40_05410 [Proteobacteria bacterium]|nr:hypothetical protein [Pseudomonadota bacterium]